MPESQLFLSPFAILIESYIAEKRTVGYKFKKGAAMLKRFDSFAYSYGLTEVILTKQLAIEWTVRKPRVSRPKTEEFPCYGDWRNI